MLIPLLGDFVVVFPKVEKDGNKKTYWIGWRGWESAVPTVGQVIKLEEKTCNLRLADDSVAVCVSLGKIQPLIPSMKHDLVKLLLAIRNTPHLVNAGWKQITPDVIMNLDDFLKETFSPDEIIEIDKVISEIRDSLSTNTTGISYEKETECAESAGCIQGQSGD